MPSFEISRPSLQQKAASSPMVPTTSKDSGSSISQVSKHFLPRFPSDSGRSSKSRNSQTINPIMISDPVIQGFSSGVQHGKLGKGACMIQKPKDAFRMNPSSPKSRERESRAPTPPAKPLKSPAKSRPGSPLRYETVLSEETPSPPQTPVLPKLSINTERLASPIQLRPTLKSAFSTCTTIPTSSSAGSELSSPLFSTLPSPRPFRALLQRSTPFPAHLSEEAKLVSLNISGTIHTLSLATIFSEPSYLADFVKSVMDREEPAPNTASIQILPSPAQYIDLYSPHSATAKIQSATGSIFAMQMDHPTSRAVDDYSYDFPESESIVFSGLPEDDEDVVDPFQRLQHRNDSQATLKSSSSSHKTPSLSSSPSTSDIEQDETDFEHDAFDLEVPQFASLLSRPPTSHLEVSLERATTPYKSVFFWLREKELPRSLQLSTSFILGDATSLAATLKDLSPGLRNLFLHPLISSLQDVRDEACYLGLESLQTRCQRELDVISGYLGGRSRSPSPVRRRGSLRPFNPPPVSLPSSPRLSPAARRQRPMIARTTTVKVVKDGWI